MIHSLDDEAFVVDHLLPRLGLPAGRVLSSTHLPLGETVQHAFEHAVLESRLSVVVLTEAYLRDRWAQFGEQLAGHAGGAEAKIVPILLADCKVPLRLDFRVALDMRNPERWATEIARLRERLGVTAPAKTAAARAPARPPPESGADGPARLPRAPRLRHRAGAWQRSSIAALGCVGLGLAALAVIVEHAAERSPRSSASGSVDAPPAPIVGSSAPAPRSTSVATEAATERAPAGAPSSATALSPHHPPPAIAVPAPAVEPACAVPDPAWAGGWTDRVLNLNPFTVYTVRVANGGVTVVGAVIHRARDGGDSLEPLQIVKQRFSESHLLWTEFVPSAHASFSYQCSPPTNGRIWCERRGYDSYHEISLARP